MSFWGPPPPPERPKPRLPEWVVIAAIAAIVIPIALCSGYVRIGGAGSSSSSTSTGISIPTPNPTAALSPTDTPVPTATPKPATIHAPVLGGTWPDFENVYGPQLGGERNLWGATIAGQPVQIYADLISEGHTTDGDEHAYVVDLQVPPQFLGVESWDVATAIQIAQTFLPADARHLSDVPVSNGLDHRYHSDALKATFAADIFTTEAGNPVDPGTLRFECNALGRSGGPIQECYISVGTQ